MEKKWREAGRAGRAQSEAGKLEARVAGRTARRQGGKAASAARSKLELSGVKPKTGKARPRSALSLAGTEVSVQRAQTAHRGGRGLEAR